MDKYFELENLIYHGDKKALELTKRIMPNMPKKQMQRIDAELGLIYLLGSEYKSQYQLDGEFINEIL